MAPDTARRHPRFSLRTKRRTSHGQSSASSASALAAQASASPGRPGRGPSTAKYSFGGLSGAKIETMPTRAKQGGDCQIRGRFGRIGAHDFDRGPPLRAHRAHGRMLQDARRAGGAGACARGGQRVAVARRGGAPGGASARGRGVAPAGRPRFRCRDERGDAPGSRRPRHGFGSLSQQRHALSAGTGGRDARRARGRLRGGSRGVRHGRRGRRRRRARGLPDRARFRLRAAVPAGRGARLSASLLHPAAARRAGENRRVRRGLPLLFRGRRSLAAGEGARAHARGGARRPHLPLRLGDDRNLIGLAGGMVPHGAPHFPAKVAHPPARCRPSSRGSRSSSCAGASAPWRGRCGATSHQSRSRDAPPRFHPEKFDARPGAVETRGQRPSAERKAAGEGTKRVAPAAASSARERKPQSAA